MNVRRFLRTARHLESGQLGWRALHELKLQAYRRTPRLSRAACAVLFRGRARPAVISAGPVAPELLDAERKIAQRWADGAVEYHGIAGDRFDWRALERSRLWRYERHYHSELVALVAVAAADRDPRWVSEAARLLESWRTANPAPSGDGWEPYPVARRILNWSLAMTIAPELGSAIASPLGTHIRFLRAHLERHLLGNHLLCDAAALMAGGAVLEGPGFERLASEGARLLAESLRRQVLADGGYAERTVQYHAIVLRDALIAIALTRTRGWEVDPALLDVVKRMAGWLRKVQRHEVPGPWLNDAAPDACPSLDGVLSLAAALGLGQASRASWLGTVFGGHPTSGSEEPRDVVLPETGWTIVRDGAHELLFDYGPLGPDEQPGHGHSDALSYELIWDGAPIVTDSGVTTYDVGPVRDFERSARAHATVTVDGEGPDELWASFRVGGRARVSGGLVRKTDEGVRVLTGRVDAWQGWVHRRQVLYWPGHALVVCDSVSGTSGIVRSHLPLDAACRIADGRIDAPCGPLRLVVLRGSAESPVSGRTHPRDGWVGEGFGRPRARPSISISADTGCRVAYAFVARGCDVILSHRECTMRGPAGEVRLPIEDHA